MPTDRIVVLVGAGVVLAVLSSSLSAAVSASSSASRTNLDSCGGRLERALDALQRDSPRRNRLDEEEAGIVYQQKLASAPLEMTVSRIAVKLPQDSRNQGQVWARVDTCSYEPKSNALRTRVMFNDLSVSGVISLLPRDNGPTAGGTGIPAESCRMSLRLRRAGIEFYTNPIARGRGQMRIRTESSFLEPRFASIYAYGCRPTRTDKQIKRYDKWPQTQQHGGHVPQMQQEPYEAPEPRGYVAALTKEEDVATFSNEDTRPRGLLDSDLDLGIWRKNIWVTRIPRKRRSLIDENNTASSNTTTMSANVTLESESNVKKNSLKRETRLFAENDFDQSLSDQDLLLGERNGAGDWLSREAIATEMEDVFLRGASQALTRYIERQLHPAIKETLMISMGYTISYG